MKTFLTAVVIIAIIGGGVFAFMRLTSVEDTWIQDKATGAWVRYGNPSGPAPRIAAADCYARAGSLFDRAVAACVPQLCARDEVCINDLLDAFESLRGTAAEPLVAPPVAIPVAPQGESAPPPFAPATSTDTAPGAGGEEETAETPSVPASAEGETEAVSAPAATPATAYEIIRLQAPALNAALTSPFQVQGDVRDAVASVVVRVKGGNGSTLIEETLTPRGASVDGWRPFKITLAYDFDHTKDGTVEVQPAGGDAVSVPVEFR